MQGEKNIVSEDFGNRYLCFIWWSPLSVWAGTKPLCGHPTCCQMFVTQVVSQLPPWPDFELVDSEAYFQPLQLHRSPRIHLKYTDPSPEA